MTEAARDEGERLLQAAAWRMRSDAGEADQAALAEWLSDARNASAWSRVDGVLDLIADHANDPRMLDLRRAALTSAQAARRRLDRPARRWSAPIAAMLAAAIVGGGAIHWATAPEVYKTAVNGRQMVVMPDGSRALLDSDSEITVRYTKAARELRLVRGQARFDVAHDASRPFSVLAGDQKVVATGTAFNIDLTEASPRVTLIEGRVLVVPAPRRLIARAPAPAAAVELHAGQQLSVAADKTPHIASADLSQVTSWTSGQLVFDDRPLSEVIARINHYAVRPIALADAETGRLRLSGSFNTGDVQGFVDMVTHHLPVRATTGQDGSVTLSIE